ncbi:enoyl-CoA hydratase/isomerase family protein [Hyphococcus sp. DH-69]|uniref:enoyl-CoA hydratase/isomerase family protein n=1 Tax=Hyphococcus formosus TaxID=3143534 RepID=UPI00398B503A
MASLPPSETLILEIDDGWLQIRFNRPEARNALSDEMASDLMGVLQRVAEDRSVRGITLRGEGNIFCAGGDLKGFQKSLAGTFTQDEAEAMSRSAGALFARINSMPQVVVAIVEGAAIAGGLGMACCADFVIAKEDAKFSLTETMLGISPAQIAPYVIQRTGQMTARRMMLTGAKFTAKEAHALGIVDIVAPSTEGLAKAADEIKASVRRCAPGANAVTKEIALASGHLNRDEMIAFAAKGFAKCMLSDEGREGILSFVEKRKPSWAKSD